MNKLFIIALLFIIDSTFANEIDCIQTSTLNPEQEDVLEDFLIPNCLEKEKVRYGLSQNEFKQLCENCKPKFAKTLKRFPALDSSKIPDLRDLLLQELKKNLVDTAFDLASLRAVYNIEGDYVSAVEKCNIDQFAIDNAECLEGSDFPNFKTKLGNEIAHLLSPAPKYDNGGLLKRAEDSNSCNFSEEEVLRAKSLVVEKELSNSEVIELILNPEIKDFGSLTTGFDKIHKLSLTQLMRSHPVLSQYRDNLAGLKSLFSKMKKPYSKETVGKLLYNDSKTNQATIDGIANKCKSAFQNFASKACSSDVKNGNVLLDKVPYPSPLFGPSPLSNSEGVSILSKGFQQNLEALQLCNLKPKNKKAVNFEETRKSISSQLSEDYKDFTFDRYSSKKYQDEVSTLSRDLCEIKTSGKGCESKSIICDISDVLNGKGELASVAKSLAATSNPNLNSVIRSIIGTGIQNMAKPDLDLLVSKGILTQSNGAFVPQPKVVEREPGFTPGQAIEPSQQAQITIPQKSFQPSASFPQRTTTSSSKADALTTPTTAIPDTTDFKETFRASTPAETDIRKNLLERFNKAKQAGTPVTASAVKSQFAQAFADQNLPVPEDYNDGYNRQAAEYINRGGATTLPPPSQIAQALAKGGSGDSKAAQKARELAAYGGMAGVKPEDKQGTPTYQDDAKALARGPASVQDSAITLPASVASISPSSINALLEKSDALKEFVNSRKSDFKIRSADATYWDVSFDGQKYKVTSNTPSGKAFVPDIEKYLASKLTITAKPTRSAGSADELRKEFQQQPKS